MTQNAARAESQLAYHRRRMEELKPVRNMWEPTWSGLADFIEPSRLRLPTDRQEQAMSRSKIIDGTATLALRTLASGMHSGITSPARPWFKLMTADPSLREYGPVRTYIDAVEKRLREIFQASNIYPSFHKGYGDLGLFGQSAGILIEDDENVVRMIQLTHGQFWIGRDEDGRATTLYRKFRWSVERIVRRFGLEKVSDTVREAWNQARYDQIYTLCHAIEPRMNRRAGEPGSRNMPFLSNYWEDGQTRDGQMLQESGFQSNPIVAPPWELSSDDQYSLSPGQIALGDVKMLQKEQTRKLEGIDKLVRPPMTGPTAMANNPASLLPGAITYVDDPTGKGFRPAMEVRISLAELANDIRETQQRIDRTFYADLFLMLSQMEGIQPRNVMEIVERKEEKLLALGPVLENIYGNQLEPVIDRTYELAEARGEFPEPPPEIQGAPLKIEYISMLAQAQKAVATGAIERVWSFAGNLAAVKPEILDKLDADQTIDEYADMVGAPASIVKSDDDVKAMRAGRQKQQQQMQNAEMAAAVAPAAKQGAEAAALLAEADAQGGGPGALQANLGLG